MAGQRPAKERGRRSAPPRRRRMRAVTRGADAQKGLIVNSTNNCASGEALAGIAQDGTSSCVPLAGGGTVTKVEAGEGLEVEGGGAITGEGKLNVNYAETQKRVTGTCTGGEEAIKSIAQDGSVECEATGGGEGGGALLTGIWAVGAELGVEELYDVPIQAPISYGTTLSAAPDVMYVFSPSGSFGGFAYVIDPTDGSLVGQLEHPAEIEADCGTGTFSSPSAEPGYLCVFGETEEEMVIGPLPIGVPKAQWVSPDPEIGAVIPFTLKTLKSHE